MALQIENGIPITGGRKPRGEVSQALRAMDISQSVHVEMDNSHSHDAMYRKRFAARTSGVMRHVAKNTGRKFAARKTAMGIRLWRVA